MFFPSIILLLTSCINPSAATLHNITMLFLFFPLRGLSIFTRPNELLNAEVLYPNLFAVKKWNMTFIYRLRGRVLSSVDDIWKLKLEIKKERYYPWLPTDRQITCQNLSILCICPACLWQKIGIFAKEKNCFLRSKCCIRNATLLEFPFIT